MFRATELLFVTLMLMIILSACGEDSETVADGDTDTDIVETEDETEEFPDGDAELDAAESEPESDADIKQPVPHGREVLPERVPETCLRTPADKPILYEGAPQDADCAVNSEGDQCNYNSDCTDSAYGICWPTFGWPMSVCSEDDEISDCTCYYHECLEDSECPEHRACLCRENGVNICAESCRSSEECGEGQRCVETQPSSEYVMSYGDYRCTSERDECSSDWDCPEDQRCIYDKRRKIIFTCIEWYDECSS